MRKPTNAFTLIELLVVIAIIGILATVVLASLNSARNKGRDAAVKNQMNQIRTQASIFYSLHGSFIGTGVGGTDDTFSECTVLSNASFTKFEGTMFDRRVEENAYPLIAGTFNQMYRYSADRIQCAVTADTWAFAVPLHNPESGTTGWCVDSHGSAKAVNIEFGPGNFVLTGGIARCP